MTASQVQRLSSILYRRRKIHLFHYKDRWFQRRLTSRLRSTRCADLNEYLAFIEHHPEELDRLVDALAINISSFFRNPEVFDGIRTIVLENWRERIRMSSQRRFIAWSCACAHGEEPYSLAILWSEFVKTLEPGTRASLKIIASDIDQDALRIASEGVYKTEAVKDIPGEWLDKYFHPKEGCFEVDPALRKMVEFREENVLLAEPRPRWDLVLCRNFLIFLDRTRQEQMFSLFADSIHPGGYLVLGRVESIWNEQKSVFRCVHTVNRIYQRL